MTDGSSMLLMTRRAPFQFGQYQGVGFVYFLNGPRHGLHVYLPHDGRIPPSAAAQRRKPDGCPSRLRGLYLFSGMDKYRK
jgi:hypothetical protein